MTACVVRGEIPAEEFALYETLRSLPDVEFEVERLVESGEEVPMPLLWIRNATAEEIENAVEEDPSVEEVTLLSTFEEELLYRMEWVSNIEVVLQILTNSHATIMDAYGVDECWQLRVLYPDRDSLSKTNDYTEQQGLDFDITAIREMEGEPVGRYGLTNAQFESLVTALDTGYYEVPRGIEQSELAEKLGISHQALSERLRRATAALIEDALAVGSMNRDEG